MTWLTFKIKRTPGFRFNLIDLSLLSGLAILSLAIYIAYPEDGLYLLPVYVGITFFLFCNVFRLGNRLEAVWYVTFILTAAYGFTDPERLWFYVLAVGEPLKIGLIVYRIMRSDYRGVFSGKIAGGRPEK